MTVSRIAVAASLCLWIASSNATEPDGVAVWAQSSSGNPFQWSGAKSLSKVAIVDPGASADDIGKVAESLGRKVKSARAAGPKKSRQIQINLM